MTERGATGPGEQRDGTAAAGRRPRVLVSHQGCIPIYRRALYERLALVPDIEYVVAWGDRPPGTDYIVAEPPFDFPTLRTENRELRLGPAGLIWQPLVGRFWRDFDAAILGDEIKYASHLALIAAARLRRRPVMLWGFGYPSGQKDADGLSRRERLDRALKSGFRRVELKLVDGYLAYTDSGAESLRAAGLAADRIATVRNTIDMEKQERLRAIVFGESEAQIRRDLCVPPDVPVLLYFGRYLAEKCLDLLIDHARQSAAAGRPVFVLLSGAGREKDALVARAAGLGNVRFASLPDLELARALRIASAVVIPGFAGLAITHAFAHGVPFLTRAGIVHPPEIDYLTPGENGLMLPHEPAAFHAALDRFLADPALQQRLRAGAREAAKRLSMDAMARTFDGLVRRLLVASGRLPRPAASAGAAGAAHGSVA